MILLFTAQRTLFFLFIINHVRVEFVHKLMSPSNHISEIRMPVPQIRDLLFAQPVQPVVPATTRS